MSEHCLLCSDKTGYKASTLMLSWLAIPRGNIPLLARIFAGSFLSFTFAYRRTLQSEPGSWAGNIFTREIFIVLRPRLVTGRLGRDLACGHLGGWLVPANKIIFLLLLLLLLT